MQWYWWLCIIAAVVIVCVLLGAHWWKKWHEVMLRMEYAVVGYLLGALTMFVLILVLEAVW